MKSETSIRIVAGLKRDPTGCCIQPLATRIHSAERLVPMAVKKVRYIGEPVAAVIAETLAQAEAALEKIKVEYKYTI